MTFKIKDTLFIADEDPGKCELCGKVDELRPYGPKGENICFDCGMKNKATTAEMFDRRLNKGN